MSDIASILTYFTRWLFALDVEGSPAHPLVRLVEFIVGAPLILAVLAMFFAGFVVSIFIRIYHTS